VFWVYTTKKLIYTACVFIRGTKCVTTQDMKRGQFDQEIITVGQLTS